MKTRSLVVLVMTSLVLVLFASSARADDLIVDDDGYQCPGAQFVTIQSAVLAAAAQPGTQKIRICEGRYQENVVIGPDADTRFEIFGDGVEKVSVTGAGTPGPIFDVLDVSLGVAIEKLTVDGESTMTGLTPLGIRYQQTSGLLKDLAVLNIRDASGGAQGVAIRINSTGPTATVRIEDNLVANWTRVGILGNGPGVDVEIEDNLVLGPIPPKVWAPNGVQVSRGARSVVKGNEVHDASIGIIPPNAGSGILLFCAGASRVEGNKIFSSDTGVNLEDSANGRIAGNEVSNSLFDAYPILGGVAAFFGDSAGGLGCPGGAQATVNNRLEGNKAFNNERDAVHVESYVGPGPSNNRVTNTDIKTSLRDGIRIVNGAGNRFVNNTMEGSGEHDAHDDQIPTPNIWRDNTCKSANPENQPGLCKP